MNALMLHLSLPVNLTFLPITDMAVKAGDNVISRPQKNKLISIWFLRHVKHRDSCSTMKRPWNLANIPVYSLATYYGEKVNMNFCTYVSAVSMKPKRYMVAVYHQTQSLQNLMSSRTAVLQLLGKQHLLLINTLGKKSGRHYDKETYLRKKKLLELWNDKNVLAHCAGLIEMEKVWSKDAGDHIMFLFDVKSFRTNHKDVLMLDDLREKKLVRI